MDLFNDVPKEVLRDTRMKLPESLSEYELMERNKQNGC